MGRISDNTEPSKNDSMAQALELAGTIAAIGIASITEGGQLAPQLGRESLRDGRQLIEFRTATLQEGVAKARVLLDTNPGPADRAVLVVDGYITLQGEKTEAVIVEVRSYADPEAAITMAIPYRNAKSSGGFAVHRPKFVDWQGPGRPDYERLGAAFLRGVNADPRLASVWAQHHDGSR